MGYFDHFLSLGLFLWQKLKISYLKELSIFLIYINILIYKLKRYITNLFYLVI